MSQRLSIYVTLFFLSIGVAFSQGTISGTILDAKSGEAVIGANILIEGTMTGTSTDIDGKYQIKIAAGEYTVKISSITYETKTLPNIIVVDGKNKVLDVSLMEEAQELNEVVVTGQADKSSEAVLLMDRKKSFTMVQAIGSQEISRRGVSDAEEAVTQVTGVSKQEGVKNVFVRGLGDRYNSTSLNGLPLPSEDPQFKNISLDFFPSQIINNIDVNKTFDAAKFGDVAGANIDITSKKLFEEREFTIGGSIGANSQTFGQDFYRADGTNFLGIADNTIPVTNLNQYSFQDSYQPNKISSQPMNSSIYANGGKNFSIGSNSLKTFFVASMNSEYFFKKGVVRQVNPNGGIRQDFNYDKYEYEASQMALASVSYEYGRSNSLSYNGIYIHDNKQSVGNYTGFSLNGNDDINDPNAYKTFVRRQQQNDNTLFVNQLLFTQALSDKLTLDIKGSFNVAHSNEPDRRSNFYIFDGDEYRINTGSPAYNHRFYSSLQENDATAVTNLTYRFGKESNNRITVGYNYRNTHRDFEATQFNFDFLVGESVNINNPDALFNQQSLDNGLFEIETGRGTNASALNPFTYTGNRSIHAGYINAVFEITPLFTVNVGGRFETIRQKVDWDTNLSPKNPNRPEKNIKEINPTYFLPSLNMKYNLGDDDILRLAASQTYTLPQFKEVAPFFYEDVNESSFGNPNLKPSRNLNVDLRYEHYFSNVELIALTGFYKQIKNPINKVQVASAANELSYVNTSIEEDGDAATVVGVELEFRKSLLSSFNNGKGTNLDFGLNVSYLYSTQPLKDVSSDELVFQPTNSQSQLEGASPLLLNTDLTYTLESGNGKMLTTTVLFTYGASRIYSLGAPMGNNDINEVIVPSLDFITKYSFNSHLSVGLNIKNLLNPDFKRTKEIVSLSGVTSDDIISQYKKGIATSIGFSYKF